MSSVDVAIKPAIDDNVDDVGFLVAIVLLVVVGPETRVDDMGLLPTPVNGVVIAKGKAMVGVAAEVVDTEIGLALGRKSGLVVSVHASILTIDVGVAKEVERVSAAEATSGCTFLVVAGIAATGGASLLTTVLLVGTVGAATVIIESIFATRTDGGFGEDVGFCEAGTTIDGVAKLVVLATTGVETIFAAAGAVDVVVEVVVGCGKKAGIASWSAPTI